MHQRQKGCCNIVLFSIPPGIVGVELQPFWVIGASRVSSKIFVGNLNFQTTQDQVRDFFADAGDVVDVQMPLNRETGRPRGFAFVTFSSPEEASAAIERLNGQELDGRALRIDRAEERARSPRGGNGGGYSQDFRGGGGGEMPAFRKGGGSRRGLRAKKRSL